MNDRVDRRTAIKWVSAAAATLGAPISSPAAPGSKGYGRDPELLKAYQPGDLWPLTFSKAQRAQVVVLCDIIIPADDQSPSASQVGVHDFVDEWISSPYPDQQSDRNGLLKGLDWLNEEAVRRGSRDFVSLESEVQLEICESLAIQAKKNRRQFPGSFFYQIRNLIAGGYYTTPEGIKDIGYRGNTPMPEWNGPSPEVLEQIGLKPEA